jgi:tripartite motif-containing protein 9/67
MTVLLAVIALCSICQLHQHIDCSVQTNCVDFEERLAAECDAIISAIRWRQQQLVAAVRRERSLKQQAYRDQVTQCTAKVHRTTGLLQFSVEVMKENDPTAFLQVRYCLN